MKELESEQLVELPARLETGAFFSPVVITTTQTALALNAVNVGGEQEAWAGNIACTNVDI